MGNGNGKGKKYKETSRQLELYNSYVSMLPQERSLRQVAQNYSVSEGYIFQLSQKLGWVARAKEHDQRRLAKLEKASDRDFVADRTKRLKQIDTSIDVAQKLIEEALKKIVERIRGDHDEGIRIRNAYDLAQVMKASRDFVELEQMITGGIDPGRVTLVQQIQQIFVGLIPENVKKGQVLP